MALYKRALLLLSIALIAAGPLIAQNTTDDRIPLFKKGAIRVLILTGQNNHDWRSTTPVLRDMLLNTGRFDVRVNEEATGMTAETLAIYNVVVLNYNGPRLGQTAENALEDFVRSGGGLVGVHGANWAFSGLVVLGDGSVPTGIMEPPWPAYKQMIGGVWSDQPPASGHAPRHKFTVKIVDPDSPITEGLPKTFEANDELYHNMHMAPGVHILATAYDDPANKSHTPPPVSVGKEAQTATGPDRSAKWPRLDNNPTGKNEPMLWTIRYGRGRTFYTTLGHDVKAMDLPGFSTTFVRGVEWAATGKVKPPAPEFRSWAEPLPSNSRP